MKNKYEKLITAKDFAKTMKAYNPAEEAMMMTVEDYIKELQLQSEKDKLPNLSTAQEYAEYLKATKYLRA